MRVVTPFPENAFISSPGDRRAARMSQFRLDYVAFKNAKLLVPFHDIARVKYDCSITQGTRYWTYAEKV